MLVPPCVGSGLRGCACVGFACVCSPLSIDEYSHIVAPSPVPKMPKMIYIRQRI